MDSAQLHVKLLEADDRLLRALARERRANVFNPMELSFSRWQERLRVARDQVQRTAENYAAALRNYRLAALSEFLPGALSPAALIKPSVISKRRRKRQSISCGLRSGRKHTNRDLRKDVATEGLPRSARLRSNTN